MTEAESTSHRRRRGFETAGSLLSGKIRKLGEARGFAVSRLLTHWAEIVGQDVAAIALPVKISYPRDGFGATLTVLTTGASAPLLQMQLPAIREKVNACYGYNAISRVAITQTAPTGFAEGQVAFRPKAAAAPRPPDPKLVATARSISAAVGDEGLRAALEALGEKVLSRSGKQKG
ncbi:DUF721 domain-containing protein [Defluviimonas sp. WL0002]|uniref:DUF721 domain-containing protein n=1 Tax=Albidovulum marisflavi TaxID=2984159 RepID=A0ABT2Z8S8_9RHOB|nr:DUF721 domain-containing protein [Defluviimonas sp. WL0002]MCV2867544.1 DUF721 domain-containing protein [Defluviimonas sp. WL0002]